jgi:hypothetical protein
LNVLLAVTAASAAVSACGSAGAACSACCSALGACSAVLFFWQATVGNETTITRHATLQFVQNILGLLQF